MYPREHLTVLVMGLVMLTGCGRPPEPRSLAAGAGHERAAPPPAPADAAPPPPDATPPASEATARVILSEMYRARGLRVRHDVRVTGDGYDVTLDGFDPQRRIGFEYVATAERGTDLNAGEADALTADDTLHVLVLDSAGEADVRALAAAFLDAVTAAAGADDRADVHDR